MSSRTLNVKDNECLLWIRDPSFSPFINKDNQRQKLSNDKTPKNILNRIKNRCFYNSALRGKIVKQIESLRKNKTPRLYESDLFKYTNPPFRDQECIKWARNHLANPRTNAPILMTDDVYIELVYTTLQYGMETPTILNQNTEDVYVKYINSIIEDVKKRLALMEKTDHHFLNDTIGTIDIPITQKVKKNSFSVSSSSSSHKSMSPGKKTKLMDMMLEDINNEKLITEYQQSKHSQRKLTEQALFTSLQTFIFTLSKEVDSGKQLIQDIVDILNDRDDDLLAGSKRKRASSKKDLTKLVKDYIRNIYSQLIDPSIKASQDIHYLSYAIYQTNFIQTSYILNCLLKYIDEYKPTLDKRVKKYIIDIIEDIIDERDVAMLSPDTRDKAYDSKYRNDYYNLLKERHLGDMRLPKGMGIQTKIILKTKRFAVDEKPQNNFTYEECKTWVSMPIFNPRTFRRIEVDSPLYNRLLCMSYQYDANLIPRMITTRGSTLLFALYNSIKEILRKTGKPSQSREDLEQYFSMLITWKKVGINKPKKGAEVIVTRRIRKTIEVPFYIYFNKDDLRGEIIADSYIKITNLHGITYYYTVIMERDASRREVINKPIVLAKRSSNFGTVYKEEDFIKWAKNPEINPLSSEENEVIIVQDSEEYNEIFEQALRFDTNIEPSNISPEGIKFKIKILKRIPEYYSLGHCLRWVRYPYINPKTTEPIVRDSPEYNAIFAKALLFDSNMLPLNISCAGIKFKNATLKGNRGLFGTEKVLKQRIKKSERVVSGVCNAIEMVDRRYLYFKQRMIDVGCYKPHNVHIDEINAAINEKFPISKSNTPLIYFDYYEDSPFASAVIYFHGIKNEPYSTKQDIFTNHSTRLYVTVYEIDSDNIIKKDTIDAGGPVREFSTKFFEELFCDDEHLTRPFIQPSDNKEGRYYINPNFVPDDKFIKVINAYQSVYGVINPSFYTYENLYYIIGKVLPFAIANEDFTLPKQFSRYILTGFTKQPKDITHYDMLYFYVCEFDNAIIYLNMISKSQISGLDYAGLTFNENYIITKPTAENPDGYQVTKENCIKFILQLAKHIITKNFFSKHEATTAKSMKARYVQLFKGFDNKMRAFLTNNNVSVALLNKMITITQLNDEVLREFANKIIVGIRGINTLNEEEKQEKVTEMKGILYKIITEKQKGVSVENHHMFIRKLLQFWTALPQYNKNADYKITYKIGNNEENGVPYDKTRLPQAQTCFNMIDFFGFPDDLTKDKKEFLYDILYNAVFNTLGFDNE
jgi:hypothetical protein